MPLVAIRILFAHLARSATMHGLASHDRMTRRRKVGIRSSPLDGMMAKAATTSLSGVGVRDTGSAAVAEKSGAW